MAAVRDKNVRGKNGDRSVDTVYYILEYRSVQASERTPVHKYTSTQNGDRSVQAGERKPRPGLNVASFEGGYPYGSPSHFSPFGK